MITLTTIIVTRFPNGSEGRLWGALGLVVLACVASGLVSGLAITWLGVTPLVATLGVNALLTGVVLQITSGASTSSAPPGLADFAIAKVWGIPSTAIVAVVAIVTVALVVRTTVVGRRFVFAGASPAAARAAGIRVKRVGMINRTRLAGMVLAALVCAAATATAATTKTFLTWPTATQEIARSGISSNIPFCGNKQVTLAVLDGFGINAWSQESFAAVRSEAAKCKNVKQIVLAGGGDLQKMIADVSSAVAQGANAIVINPDLGEAELAAIKQATAAGVKVVAVYSDPGGSPGADYVSVVKWNNSHAGTIW